jgi:hypothetical protein
MKRQVSTMDELVMLEPGTVLRGPDWHAEVYVKFSDVEFYAPGSEAPYRASEVQARGPYMVLWPFAEEPSGV